MNKLVREIFVLVLVLAVALGSAATVQAQQPAPCGVDGRKCQCAKWHYLFTSYGRADETITNDGQRQHKCRNREDCANKYQEFVAYWREAAEKNREQAQVTLKRAQYFRDNGDERRYQTSMKNHRIDLVRAKQFDLKVDSAVPPHCRDSSSSTTTAETASSGEPVVDTQSHKVGVSSDNPQFEFSDEGKKALNDIQEQFKQSNLSNKYSLIYIWLTTLNTSVATDVGNALAIFPWEEWTKMFDSSAGRDHQVLKDIRCYSETISSNMYRQATNTAQPEHKASLKREAKFWEQLSKGCQ